MEASVNVKWTGDMSFKGEIDGHEILLDASAETGGNDSGPRPKKLMLLALAGCTAMDVVSLLKKMRVVIDEFTVDVIATQTEGEHPHIYKDFKIIYKFKGNDLGEKMDKIIKAINFSQEKYCGVAAMLKHIGPINYEIDIY